MKKGTVFILCIALFLAVIVPQELYADAAPSGPFLAIFIGAMVLGAIVLGVAVYHIFNAPVRGYTELEFEEEEVILELAEAHSRVSCTFYIMNNSTGSYSGMFYFPFVVDDAHPFPDDIRVSYAVNGKVTEPAIEHKDNRIFFGLTLAPEERTVLLVNYTQTNLEPRVTYVITSANDWNQPVGKATFEIHHPAGWQDVSLSHSPQTTIEYNNEVIHTIYIEDLAPDRELEITWNPSE
jgi:hypothetical protein